MFNINHLLYLLIVHFTFSLTLSNSDILSLFGDNKCLIGSLESLQGENVDLSNEMNLNIDFVKEALINDHIDKSDMSSINELAQFNDISYSYELIKEEGPPHNKIFTVTLHLGDEQYTGKMQSIKKAQQNAAALALKSTIYEHPPLKIKEHEKALTPTSMLNNLAGKLGLAVSYKVVTDDLIMEQLVEQNEKIDFAPKKSYLQKLNETVHSNDTIHVRKDGADPKSPFTVSVNVNGANFFGKAHTIKGAKHEAALTALKHLKENEAAFHCPKEDGHCESRKQNNKSPISLVYEAGQKRNLGVSFEVIDEIGPSHKKLFTTKCTVGELEATGEGKSKKESKRAAAENILPLLLELPEVNIPSKTVINSSKKTKKRNKKDKVIKSTFDKIDRMFDNMVDFGKNLVGSISGDQKSADVDLKPKKKDKKLHRSPAKEVLQLGKILNLDIQYRDFMENGKSYSVLDLDTKPSFICLGEGVNEKNARDLASHYGISILYKMGLLDNLLDKSMKIGNFLDKEEAFEQFYLGAIIDNENQDEKKM